MEAMERSDWDEALRLLKATVRLVPGNALYRKKKHSVCRRIFERTGGVSVVNRIKLVGIQRRLKAAAASGDWQTADELAEEAIELTPRDDTLYAEIAESATRQGHNDVSLYAWKQATRFAPNNKDWIRSLGHAYEAQGNYAEAKDCYRRLLNIDPGNSVAIELLRRVDVSIHLKKNHARRFREDPKHEPGLTPEAEVGRLLQQAEESVRKSRFAEANRLCQQAMNLASANADLTIKAENAQLNVLRYEALAAEKAATAAPKSTSLRETADALYRKQRSREIDVLTRRTQESPGDLTQMYRLAEALRRDRQNQEAIDTYLKVCAAGHLQAECCVGIGECAVRSKQSTLARRHLRFALTQTSNSDKPDVRKAAHYWLARLFERERNYSQAARHYEAIRSVDPDYRDITRRLNFLFTVTWT